MKKITKTIYIANDGKEFDNPASAIYYEINKDLKEESKKETNKEVGDDKNVTI